MSDISVSEAIKARRSVRAFSDRAVDKDTVLDILEIAGYAPSNSNLQPWHAYVVTGEALLQMLGEFNKDLYTDGKVETPEFPTYPEKLQEPYRTRRYECGERLYQSLGIEREDKAGRIKQVMKNYQFFGAPVGIILTMADNMDMGQAMDIGIFAQNVMLLAKERGLDTCPQVSWTQWPNRVRSVLGIAENERVMIGIAMGYGTDDAVNHLDHPRAKADDFASLSGF